jgi:hypothetical protein
MKTSPANKVVKDTLLEIKMIVGGLDSNNPLKLVSELGDLESKIGALRSFIFNHLMPKPGK